MLEESDPAEHAVVSRLLLSQREQAMPVLLDAVTNAYLGTRIAASEMLHQLAPAAATFDPWQSPADLEKDLAALRKWWADAGALPPAAETSAPDPSLKASVEAALQGLDTDDPVKRTAAMSALVDDGAAALPAVRAAIRRHEQAGDRATALLLEDVAGPFSFPTRWKDNSAACAPPWPAAPVPRNKPLPSNLATPGTTAYRRSPNSPPAAIRSSRRRRFAHSLASAVKTRFPPWPRS